VLAELLAHDGVTESCELRSQFGFMAIHGGSLERGTAEVARAAAEAASASLYTIEQPEDFRWHLPSHLVSPDASPTLAGFLDHVDVVVSVHGYGRDGFWTRVLLGGSNRDLAAALSAQLALALPGFEMIDDLEVIPVGLRGLHPTNPANLARHGGVQLELPPRVRGLGPHGTEALRHALVAGLAAFPASAA
jgi:phage replication-related protein YjqB (UPF0714/DUF867 family)